MIRKIITAVLGLSMAWMSASERVTVKITDGIYNDAIKSKMERTVSAILTEANAAFEQNRALNCRTLGISSMAQSGLEALWENSPFVSMDSEIVEHCVKTGSGYQVRNIPILLKPKDENEIDKDDEYQEAVVSFDKQGNMESFYISISMNLYMNVVRENKEITDLRRRQLILDYVEQFRTAYNQKDLNFLEQVYSDDALIITGKVIRRTKDGIPLPDKVEYLKQNKVQYMAKLRRIFSTNKRLRVTFDEIEVIRHPTNHDFYGVTLHQGWSADYYHDDGYLFLLWDFRNEDSPQIHVRTWQPDAYNSDGKGVKKIAKDEIFSLSDFNIE